MVMMGYMQPFKHAPKDKMILTNDIVSETLKLKLDQA